MSDNTSTSPKPELSVENHTEVRITPYYQNAGITIYNARAEDVLDFSAAPETEGINQGIK